MSTDLNRLLIPTDGPSGEPLGDHSVVSEDGSVAVYFRDLERRIIGYIEAADVVIGCVAWLTSFPILDALAQKAGVSLVVQKEDFLRPDVGVAPRMSSWKRELRQKYEQLRPMCRFDFTAPLCSMSTAIDYTIEAVRCVGVGNTRQAAAMPRAHHKFVVFCKGSAQPDQGVWVVGERPFQPYAVWTGSFNFTKNAAQSFENAVVLTDPTVVRAFEREHAQIAALSEPLDWRTEWVEPEWRIGT